MLILPFLPSAHVLVTVGFVAERVLYLPRWVSACSSLWRRPPRARAARAAAARRRGRGCAPSRLRRTSAGTPPGCCVGTTTGARTSRCSLRASPTSRPTASCCTIWDMSCTRRSRRATPPPSPTCRPRFMSSPPSPKPRASPAPRSPLSTATPKRSDCCGAPCVSSAHRHRRRPRPYFANRSLGFTLAAARRAEALGAFAPALQLNRDAALAMAAADAARHRRGVGRTEAARAHSGAAAGKCGGARAARPAGQAAAAAREEGGGSGGGGARSGGGDAPTGTAATIKVGGEAKGEPIRLAFSLRH